MGSNLKKWLAPPPACPP